MGFITFGAATLLGFLSIALFLQASFTKKEAQAKPLFGGTLWQRILFVLMALLIYSWVMSVAGYLISTFLLMAFLFWIVKGQKWWGVLTWASLITLISYFVFSKWLGCQFPEGLFAL